MKTKQIYLKLGKIHQNLLTFWLRYANIILGYTGIIVYFDGQKLYVPLVGLLDHPDKKQKQNYWLKLADLSLFGQNTFIGRFIKTFCFLSKRLFVTNNTRSNRNSSGPKNKNQKQYASWLLPATRHVAPGGSQQGHGDSLGAAGINPQSDQGQPRLALLHQGASGRDYSVSQTDRLFSPFRQVERLKDRLGLLSLLFFNFTCPSYVLADQTILYSPRLVRQSDGSFY